jgi:glycosyltransferase involved in cell wall biosynthesis
MVETLAAVDAVPVPQRQTTFAESQIPAKVLDAMAMGRPVVASRVGDLPEILDGGTRGWIMEPDDALSLAHALAEIAAHPAEASRRGLLGREWFLREASAATIHARLAKLLNVVLEARGLLRLPDLQ